MWHSWPKIVAHADMDAFYAAVEQLDDPALRGRPILVGGRSNRGVVLTASYEARPYGVGSAMPMAEARRRCPDALIVPPRFDRYQELSARIMSTFADFSPKVEALSLDEAFLDMSGSEHIFGPPKTMGRKIKAAVFETTGGLTASVGVSGTKYVAKVASAFDKPDGLTVVRPDKAAAWLAPLPVSRLWGAGPKTQRRLAELGFETIGDIAAADPVFLEASLGSAGGHFFNLAHARDPRRVARRNNAKSLGCDRTLAHDVAARGDIERHLRRAADTIGRRLRRKGYLAGGVRVKLKTSTFKLLTRQRRLAEPTDVAVALHRAAVDLLDDFDDSGPFRLIGLAAYELTRDVQIAQHDLFEQDNRNRQRRLEATIDALSDRFGSGAVLRARELENAGDARLGANLDFLDDGEEDA